MLKSLKSESNLKDCIIASVPKPALEWTEDKIKYTYQMTPQEYNEYVEDYLRLWKNIALIRASTPAKPQIMYRL